MTKLSLTSNTRALGVSRQILIMFAISILAILSFSSAVDANPHYSDLPPPPQKPERFTSKQQLKEYLVKLHEYYAIIGRPRFGRSSQLLLSPFYRQQSLNDVKAQTNSNQDNMNSSEISDLINEFSETKGEALKKGGELSMPASTFVHLVDRNSDGSITGEELTSFLKIFYKTATDY